MITDHEFTSTWTEALPGLRSYALGLSRDRQRVDDLVQQTALQAWEARGGLRDASNVRSWLFVILRNCHFGAYRRPKLEVEDPDGIASGSVAVPPAHESDRELSELEAALDGLPHQYREALSHVVLDGFSYEETARRCACKLGTVKSRVARARSLLMGELDRPRVRRISRPRASSLRRGAPRSAHQEEARHATAPR